MFFARLLLALLLGSVAALAGTPRLATFRAEVTPPVGSPLCGGLVKPVAGVTDPLLALGVVLLGDEPPVVLCAVDWCEIRNGDHLRWREALARAAGTTPERVAVHSLHQHNAPIGDREAHEIMAPHGIAVMDVPWAEQALEGVAAAVKASLERAEPFDRIGLGEGRVVEVASNRRILGENGRIAKMRLSAAKDPALRELPEGLVDPMLKTVSVWHGDRKLAALHYYATHPMSYYGDGQVTFDFVGAARERRTRDDGVPHLYFTGCGGNIAAGKYNDGSPEARVRLGERIHAAMVDSEKTPRFVPAGRLEWRTVPLVFRANPEFPEERMMNVVGNGMTAASTRISAAFRVGFIRRAAAGIPVPITCLHLGDEVRLLHLPGESFIEYQRFAQEQSPGRFVATASYGDGGTGYIPLEKSFAEGGYEPTQAFAAPDSEKPLKEAISTVLGPR